MGELAVSVLLVALCAVFGAGGVVLGLYYGVRSVVRDEERWASAMENAKTVLQALDETRNEWGRMKVAWASTLEEFEQLSTLVERRQRRAVSAEANLRTREDQEPLALTPAQERQELRKRIPRIGRTG